MTRKSQFRLDAITGSFGSSLGSINDNLANKSALADIDVLDLSGSLSYLASSIRRIHGGNDFSNQESGEFTLDLLPSTTNTYSLGSDSKAWLNVNLVSGSIQSITAPGTNTEEAVAIIGDAGTSLVFSASLDSNTLSHNFQGLPLELDSLADTLSEYTGMKKDGDVNTALFNISGSLYFGDDLLNAPYQQIKSFTSITSAVAAGNPASNANFSTIDISNVPVANRYQAIEVYMNGQLMESGSLSEVNAGSKDYFLDDSTDTAADLIFSTNLDIDDTIGVIGRYTSNVAVIAQSSGGGGGSTSLSIAGDSGSDTVTVGTDTLTFDGNSGITTAVVDNEVDISISFDGLSSPPSIVSADELLVLDATDSAVKKITFGTLSNTLAGSNSATGLENDGQTIKINVSGLNMNTVAVDSDTIILDDGDRGDTTRTTRAAFLGSSLANFAAGLTATTLSGSSTLDVGGVATFASNITTTNGNLIISGSSGLSGAASFEDYIMAELSIPGLDVQTDSNAFRFNCPYGLIVESLNLYLDQHTTSGNVTVTVTNTTDTVTMATLSISGTDLSASTSSISNASCDAGDVITFAITATPADAQGLRANVRFRRNI